MGYRSEVCLALDKGANSALEAMDSITEHTLLGDAEEKIVCSHDGFVKYYWSHVKWYEGFPEVDMIMSMIHKLPDDSFGFVRLGEDPSDPPEEHGDPSLFDIFTTRSISF